VNDGIFVSADGDKISRELSERYKKQGWILRTKDIQVKLEDAYTKLDPAKTNLQLQISFGYRHTQYSIT
jgi:hypothetical protein